MNPLRAPLIYRLLLIRKFRLAVIAEENKDCRSYLLNYEGRAMARGVAICRLSKGFFTIAFTIGRGCEIMLNFDASSFTSCRRPLRLDGVTLLVGLTQRKNCPQRESCLEQWLRTDGIYRYSYISPSIGFIEQGPLLICAIASSYGIE